MFKTILHKGTQNTIFTDLYKQGSFELFFFIPLLLTLYVAPLVSSEKTSTVSLGLLQAFGGFQLISQIYTFLKKYGFRPYMLSCCSITNFLALQPSLKLLL
jgi:hypothetical protein